MIDLYKKNFKNENLIVSTWKDNNAENLLKIKDKNIKILFNKPDNNSGPFNLNNQIKTSYNGIKFAKELGSKYVLKNRCDQPMYGSQIFDQLINLSKEFPINSKYKNKIKSRIIFSSFDSFFFRCFSFSDMLNFGHTNDMLNFWNSEYYYSKLFKQKYPQSNIVISNETYLVQNFLKRNNFKYKFNFKDHLKSISEIFCFVDKEFFDLVWDKYDAREYRWKSYKHPKQTTEISFLMWLFLKNNNKSFFEKNKNLIIKIVSQDLKNSIWEL